MGEAGTRSTSTFFRDDARLRMKVGLGVAGDGRRASKRRWLRSVRRGRRCEWKRLFEQGRRVASPGLPSAEQGCDAVILWLEPSVRLHAPHAPHTSWLLLTGHMGARHTRNFPSSQWAARLGRPRRQPSHVEAGTRRGRE